MKQLFMLFPLAGLGLACGNPPTGSDGFTAEFAVAGNSGCYTVKFNTFLLPTGPLAFTGPITGDIEGTANVQFDFANAFTGATNLSGGTFNWNVTDGIIPDLNAFSTEFENRNVLVLGPPGGVFQGIVTNRGTHRTLGGVGKANLTYLGETDVTVVPSETSLDHEGVICL